MYFRKDDFSVSAAPKSQVFFPSAMVLSPHANTPLQWFINKRKCPIIPPVSKTWHFSSQELFEEKERSKFFMYIIIYISKSPVIEQLLSQSVTNLC